MQFGRFPLVLQCQFFTENEDWNEKKTCVGGGTYSINNKKVFTYTFKFADRA